MPLSAKEKMRNYRLKLKTENPEKYEEQRKKNLARIKSKKKKISEMTPAEAEAKRKQWREEKKMSRQRCQDHRRPSPVRDINICSTSNQENRKMKKLQLKLKLSLRKNKRYEAEIKNLKTIVERYKKKIQRLNSQTNKSIATLEKTLEKAVVRNEVLESTLKTTFLGCNNDSDKRSIKKIIHNSRNKQYTSKILGLKVTARQKIQKKKQLAVTEIADFYIRDDVSRITSGKKECRVKNKQKKQIRYLIDSVPNLFKKYKAEGGRYGLTTFYKRKPFFVLSPYLQSRSTCLCDKHDNIKLKYETLRKHHIIDVSFDQLLQELVCRDTKNHACMYNICNECKNKMPRFSATPDMFDKTITWHQWERQVHVYSKKAGTTVQTKKTVRATKTDTAQNLMQYFSHDLIAFKKHYYNNFHQQNQYQQAVRNIKTNEAIIVCDFSENYESKLTEEIQSMHFGASKSQISLHTGMIYFKTESQSFCTMSDNLNHQPPAIWAHLSPILTTVKERCPDIEVIHYFSDGPTSQYRQKHNFFLHSLFTRDLNLTYSTWSYFEAGHGKSVADGIGGTIKRMLDSKVCHGTDIKNARDAYEAIKDSDTIIKVHLIEDDMINNISKRIPGDVLMLPGTMKIHQITACDGVTIKYRDVSCFCEPERGNCSCFSPGQHTLLSSNLTKTETASNNIEKDLSTSISCEVATSSVQILNDTPLVEQETLNLVELKDLLSQPVPVEPFEELSRVDEETELFDKLDMEGIKVFAENLPSEIDSDLDINMLPLIILPEKELITSPEPKCLKSVKKTDVYTPKPCSSNILSKKPIHPPNDTKISLSPGPSSGKQLSNNTPNPVYKHNKTKFPNCTRCDCSILGRYAKCMACKQLFCEDCAGYDSLYMDNLCDACLLGSDDEQL